MLKRTQFYQAHKDSSAKLIDFGGFEMPVNYEGIKAEHNCVREAVGVFDVSHMGEIFISGSDSLSFIQKITINDASKLVPGKAQYSAMCYENGGIVDDLLVYMLAENEYLLVINASNIDKDVAWMTQFVFGDVIVDNRSENMCLLAVQGPKSVELIQRLTDLDVSSISYYSFKIGTFCGMSNVIVSATGYTGEKGFELYFNESDGNPITVWNTLMESGADLGIKPTGLGARDTLRLEMGYALYGNDISSETNPYEAGLGWITKLDKDEFNGKQALVAIKAKGVTRKLTGFIVQGEKQVPRAHYAICNANREKIGEVSSGGLSITLGTGIGLGYVDAGYLKVNTELYISIRGKLIAAHITKPPFLRK
ncbi:MAG: glycine cleavage system aminomethyltransferase GcvT [Bacteroidetes bacterium]|nr:glycine cleavage system aminomethyltransferase GcvT [Bacteroidota bacterium]NCQ11816.1 glycine cleavage system aminomethyltransferase GcvT [Bacteroidota bacterium]